MRISTTSIIAATTYLAGCARALPHPAPPATYNVVDVGGPTDAPTDSATAYETVKTTLPAKTTLTEVASATTITTTPTQVTTAETTASTTISSQWTVVIVSNPTLTSSSSTTCTSTSTSSGLTSTATSIRALATTTSPPSETASPTADDGLYHPPGDNGQYRAYKPKATPLASTTAYAAGAAAASGWPQPWNATNNYVKRDFAAPSRTLPSPNIVKHLEML